MCLLDYKFMVLDNAFLIHKPGIKRKFEIPKQNNLAEEEVKMLKRKLGILLGNRDGCS